MASCGSPQLVGWSDGIRCPQRQPALKNCRLVRVLLHSSTVEMAGCGSGSITVVLPRTTTEKSPLTTHGTNYLRMILRRYSRTLKGICGSGCLKAVQSNFEAADSKPSAFARDFLRTWFGAFWRRVMGPFGLERTDRKRKARGESVE